MALEQINATQLTPVGMGAIAVVRISAPSAVAAEKLFAALAKRDGPSGRALRSITRVSIVDGDGTAIDDGLLIPTSQTEWELHVHGGVAVMGALLERLRTLGVVVGEAVDDTESQEAILAKAATMSAVRLILGQPAARARWAASWRGWLQGTRAGELWQFHAAVQWALHRSNALSYFLRAPRVAIIGPPNAGKSTLANALLGRPAAITSDIAGTTRDWVDGEAVLSARREDGTTVDLAVMLVDTAGIRETADPLERQSIRRSHEQAGRADVVIVLFDGTRLPTVEELRLAAPRAGQWVIPAVNKADVSTVVPADLQGIHPLVISAKTGAGLPALATRILTALDLASSTDNELFLATPRQYALFERLSREDDPAACLMLLERWTAEAIPASEK